VILLDVQNVQMQQREKKKPPNHKASCAICLQLFYLQ